MTDNKFNKDYFRRCLLTVITIILIAVVTCITHFVFNIFGNWFWLEKIITIVLLALTYALYFWDLYNIWKDFDWRKDD